MTTSTSHPPTPFALSPSSGPPPSVRVPPSVLLAVADAFARRAEGASRVVGSLLGGVEGGVVCVRAAFAVPHSETEDHVALDITHHHNLLALHRRASPRDAVVGWFATTPDGAPPAGGDALIHDFYARECAAPIHLTIDTSLRGDRVAVTAYSGRTLVLAGTPRAAAFSEVPLIVDAAPAERAGARALLAFADVPCPATDTRAVHASLESLAGLLRRGAAWAADVAAGKAEPDAAAAAGLASALAALPPLPAADLEAAASAAAQDSLLVLYLSKLLEAQVALSDRLGTAALPLV